MDDCKPTRQRTGFKFHPPQLLLYPKPSLTVKMSTATQCDNEHEILTYIRAKQRMCEIIKKGTPMIMKMGTPLTKALDAMSCIPFIQNAIAVSDDPKYSHDTLTIAGVEAGTLYNPKVDVILEKSIPSSFGKGSETVLDLSYRSGREIHGENIEFGRQIWKGVLYDVKRVMFPGREVDVKFYKLAIYEVGGHFDWHKDSTHSDKHHATLLVALNTSWEGGDLVLRRNGIETHVDLRPQNPTPHWIDLQTVVFFTDTEHRVEPVKSGIRIVLQFDVELEKTQEDERKGDQDEETGYRKDVCSLWMGSLEGLYSDRMKMGGDAQAATDKATIEKVLAIIKKLHKNGTQEVAFALQHLYRKASISAEYLKGSDATLYDALKASGEFDVSLHPVMFQEQSEDDYTKFGHYVYRCDTVDSEVDDKKQKHDNPAFHIPELSGIQEISTEYEEYTGNEALSAEFRYFGGGMFVRPKNESSTK